MTPQIGLLDIRMEKHFVFYFKPMKAETDTINRKYWRMSFPIQDLVL